jgi:uncharacterized protein YkwD
MIKKIFSTLALILLIISLAFLGWYFYQQSSKDLNKIRDDIDTTISEIDQKINTPGPLVSEEGSAQPLSVKGIIDQTNKERVSRGLGKLSENKLLNSSAKAKALDMFKDQYFAHDSLAGLGVGDLVTTEGYKYLIVGENLALGNFNGDKGVVEAWMDSPGHRANILKEGYREIGVGVIEDIYQGEKVWMAVQHFATPKSACTSPNQSLQSQIDDNNLKLSQLENKLEQLEKDLDNAQSKEEYRRIKEEYNSTVEQYNELVRATKLLRDQYNRQVKEYNSCLKSFN